MSTTLRGVLRAVREKHFHIAESSGSLGIIGIVCLVVALILLLWKQFLGALLSKIVAVILIVAVPLFNL